MKTEITRKGIGTGAVVAAVIAVVLIAAAAYFIFVPSTTTSATTSTSTSTSSSSTSSSSTSSSSSSTSSSSTTQVTGTGPTYTITIPNGIGSNLSLNFEPSSLSVAAGTTIIWVNQDTSTHNIDFTSTPSGVTIPTSPNTPSWTNNEYNVTLTTPGTYTYVCDYHNWMKGTITVTPSTTTSSTSTSSSSSTTTTSSSPTSSSTVSTVTSTSTPSTSSSGPSVNVTLPNGIGSNTALNFMPNSLTVAPGTTIVFINMDTTSVHNIDFTVIPSGAASIAVSPNTNKWTDNEYSVTLTTPGNYTFICDYHSWMIGTITVT